MTDIGLEQAIYGSRDSGGYRMLAFSPGFSDAWKVEAERLCTGFGDRPAGVACPASLFARPFGKRHIAIVQVADQGVDDAGRPGTVAFHLLVLPRDAYLGFGGDPFVLADCFPPPWQAKGELPSLSLPAKPFPARTVSQVQTVLQRADGPTLLGTAQALVDGGRVVFERSGPDTELLRSLWTLLPTSTRADLWPCSFAFGNALGFHVLVTPRTRMDEFSSYLTEQQAGDYPEGRYELSLQIAAESNDQQEINALFARRSAAETWKLGLILFVVLAVLLTVMGYLQIAPPARNPTPPAPAPAPEHPLQPNLPPVENTRPLTEPELKKLVGELELLARKLGDAPPAGTSIEQLLQIIDERLGTPDRRRSPGPLCDWGPPRRQLQVLCWKHGVDGYNNDNLNASELLERLEAKVPPPKPPVKDSP